MEKGKKKGGKKEKTDKWLWAQVFENGVKNFDLPDEWTIQRYYKVGKPLAKSTNYAHFQCQKCGNVWSSMFGLAHLYVKLTENPSLPTAKLGVVGVKLFGQKCKKCDSKDFYKPRFAKWAIEEILEELIEQIGQKYYKWPPPRIKKGKKHRPPKKPHEEELCEGCQLKVCPGRKNQATQQGRDVAEMINALEKARIS